jgi:hypothetical protein
MCKFHNNSIKKRSEIQTFFYLEYFHLPTLIEPSILNCLTFLRNFYHHINIMLKMVTPLEIPLFGSLEYINKANIRVIHF